MFLDLNEINIANNCIHCGMCLPTCPTYNLTGNEISSPRGRIKLITEASKNNSISKEFLHEINFCLDCQACETVCPAGIKYGKLVEKARVFSSTRKKYSLQRMFKKIILYFSIYNKSFFKIIAKFIRFLQVSAFFNLIQLISPKVLLLPKLNKIFFSELNNVFYPSLIKKKYSVGLISGCIMDVAFSKVHFDTIFVLQQQGCDVIVPKNQGCCGSIHGHNGELENSRNLAIDLINKFDIEKLDAIIVNSSGCAAFMKHYDELFHDNNFKKFSKKIVDFTEFLDSINFNYPEKKLNLNVTYHDACHLAHTQRITSQPRNLIRNIPGINYFELNEANWCCGSAGIYNITHFDDSMKILDRKINNINLLNVDYCVTTNPGCLIQIDYGLKKNFVKTETIHIASLLKMLYDQSN